MDVVTLSPASEQDCRRPASPCLQWPGSQPASEPWQPWGFITKQLQGPSVSFRIARPRSGPHELVYAGAGVGGAQCSHSRRRFPIGRKIMVSMDQPSHSDLKLSQPGARALVLGRCSPPILPLSFSTHTLGPGRGCR